jgi:hypothetical protein
MMLMQQPRSAASRAACARAGPPRAPTAVTPKALGLVVAPRPIMRAGLLLPGSTVAAAAAAAAAANSMASAVPQQQQQQQSQRPPPTPARGRGRRDVACAAASSSPDGGASSSPATTPAWRIPVYIVFWYAFNIVFNILNKTALNTFPCPWLIATWQLAASGLFMTLLWLTGLQPRPPKPTKEFLLALLPVAFFHTVGHVSACVAFSQVAVSFTHVIKSAEPVFSVLLQGPILGTPAPPYYVWLSLVPIMAGCSLSAIKEVSFAWSGFNNAMISNLGMVLRNIYSKKSLNKYKVREREGRDGFFRGAHARAPPGRCVFSPWA